MASSEPWGRGISWADVRRSFEIGYLIDVARGDGIDGLIGVGGLEPCTRFLRNGPRGGRGRGRNRRPGREPDQPFRRSRRPRGGLGGLLDAEGAIMRACWVTIARMPETRTKERSRGGRQLWTRLSGPFETHWDRTSLISRNRKRMGPKRSRADRAPTPESKKSDPGRGCPGRRLMNAGKPANKSGVSGCDRRMKKRVPT
jgi:hypothetical protein